ncbi:MAG: hypothetical protein V4572_04415 [Bacteroidota bacterium]
MKKIFVFMILFCINLNAQNNEFKVYNNGLIYSENSVAKLKHIVDSLNLKFKVCEFNKTFLSCSQTKANYVRLEKSNVLEAKKDLENNISYLEFKAKYPKANFNENLVLVKSLYINYENIGSVDFSSLELGKSQSERIISTQKNIDSYKNSFKGKWIFDFQEKTKYSEASLEAFYFVEEFKTKPITDKYARLIQYSDCMIDTTAQVFYDKAKDESGLIGYDPSLPNKAVKFNLYIDKVLKKPSFSSEKMEIIYRYEEIAFSDKSKKMSKKDTAHKELLEKEYEAYQKESEKWESLRLSRLDSLKKADSNFMLLLNDALVEVKANSSSNDEFEEYVGRYVSKETELELKRNRRVMGGCSMDSRPRIHALNIALLSAETTKWEIFLRSHLDIMNDRFDRVSDGSYAQGTRNTYIKEIEVLDINVLDLILGISLRIENPSKNHYFSSINRVGRALSESGNPRLMETTVLNMISDNDLDDFNRILMYYLFDNYNHNLTDENTKKLNQTKLQLAVSNMPDYISSRILKN